MKRICILVTVALVAVGAACKVVASTIRSECPPSSQMMVVKSPNLRCNDTVLVFSPAGDTLSHDMPTMFLLHGYGGNYADWSTHMDLQALSDRTGFRVICPDGFYKSWYFNDANPAKMQWRSFFWEELWPLLDSKYGLSAERTFITGLSMGGHGAMNLFLDHPERFRGAGSMSGVINLANAGSRYSITQILGVSDINNPKCSAQSAVNRIGRISDAAAEFGFDPAKKLLVVSCGTEDNSFYPGALLFSQRCREKGFCCITMFSPARHSWSYWTWVVNYHADWFRQAMDGGELGNGK